MAGDLEGKVAVVAGAGPGEGERSARSSPEGQIGYMDTDVVRHLTAPLVPLVLPVRVQGP